VSPKYLLNKFNTKTLEWLDDLEKIDAELIHVKPSKESWSFAEVYDHVMKVSRTYQIPNLKKSVTSSAKRRKRKNRWGFLVFNFRYRKNIHMKMEEFPKRLVELFTPIKRSKEDLLQDFKGFIKEVNELEDLLKKSTKKHKNYHPMFGDINTKEWFALIELHIWQHDKQKRKIKEFLKLNN